MARRKRRSKRNTRSTTRRARATRPARRRRAAKTRAAVKRGRTAKVKLKVKTARRPAKRAAKPRKRTRPPARASARSTRGAQTGAARVRPRPARLDRERRTLDDVIPSPPSSLDLDRRPSAARTGRSEMAERRADHSTLTPAITAGDVDANVEDAYFTGEEAPGGDNSTPDQDRVDDIGRALGVQYQDDEELRGAEKVEERDRHRWERNPASSDDYRDRK